MFLAQLKIQFANLAIIVATTVQLLELQHVYSVFRKYKTIGQ